MSDVGLFWDSEQGSADFALLDNDLATDEGLQTAVWLSLFTDRRAEDADILPDNQTDRRGWWGDAVPVTEGDKIGSRLWLLVRSKASPDVPARAKEYALEALQWLVEDKVASSVDVESGIVGKGVLGLTVSIYRPKADLVKFSYQYNWAAQLAQVL